MYFLKPGCTVKIVMHCKRVYSLKCNVLYKDLCYKVYCTIPGYTMKSVVWCTMFYNVNYTELYKAVQSAGNVLYQCLQSTEYYTATVCNKVVWLHWVC